MPPDKRRQVLLKAFVGSFAVYLLPLAQRHGVVVVGVLLGIDVGAVSGGDRELGWAAADFGVALAAQAILFTVFWWVFSGRGVRWLALLAVLPILTWFVNLAMMIWTPTHFLIEDVSFADQTDLPVLCAVEDARLGGVDEGIEAALSANGRIWIEVGEEGRATLLTVPGCEQLPSEVAHSDTGGKLQAARDGTIMFARHVPGESRIERKVMTPSGRISVAEPAPVARYWAPKLSRDGQALVWIDQKREGARFSFWLMVRDLATGVERRIHIQPPADRRPELIDADLKIGRFVVVNQARDIYGLDPEGAAVWGPVSRPEIGYLRENLRRVGTRGFVFWQSYREKGRYLVSWTLDGRSGRHEVPLGRAITDVAVSSDGVYIAISTSSGLNIGSVPDAVYALRSADGTEVFRRTLPRYARSQLAILGPRHLAYSRYNGTRQWIEVVELP